MDLSSFPSSEAEFRGRFADEDHCREHLARLKWPERASAAPTARVTEPTSCRRSGWSTRVRRLRPAGLGDRRDDPRTEQEAARPLVPRHLRGHRVEAGHLGTATQARARQLSDGVVLAHEDPHRHGPAQSGAPGRRGRDRREPPGATFPLSASGLFIVSAPSTAAHAVTRAKRDSRLPELNAAHRP